MTMKRKPATKRKPTTTKRRPTIGVTPLAALVPPPRAERRRQEREVERQQAAGEQQRRSAALVAAKVAGPPAPARPAPPGKMRFTVHVPTELVDRARNAVVALSGPPVRLTLATLAETAIRREVERLQREHHGGKPFPKRDGDLKGGRPIRA